MTERDIARVAHEVNRALCAAFGDHSQVPWEDAPDWQRASAEAGVRFCLANPDAPPSANHDAWLADKRASGWIWGPVKNPDLKQHPCMVPYAELPAEQRVKDYVFKAVVAGLAAPPPEGRQ